MATRINVPAGELARLIRRVSAAEMGDPKQVARYIAEHNLLIVNQEALDQINPWNHSSILRTTQNLYLS